MEGTKDTSRERLKRTMLPNQQRFLDNSHGISLDSPLIDPKPSDRTVHALLSEELLSLSLQDRSAVEEEIHGVRCMATAETPELLIDRLREFDAELIRVKRERERHNTRKQASQDYDAGFGNVLRNVSMPETENEIIEVGFEQSEKTLDTSGGRKKGSNGARRQQSHHRHPMHLRAKKDCYINKSSVRLRFLRSECFDVKKAVRRFVSYLDHTQLLFGDFIAHRPARFSDFLSSNDKNNVNDNVNDNDNDNGTHNHDEVKCLLQSRLMYLPFRDRTGRRICCAVGHANHKIHTILRHKIMMYLDWIVSEDIETQRKGIVIIAWPSGEETSIADGEPNSTSIHGNVAAGSNQQEDIWSRCIRPSLSQRDIWFQKKSFESSPLRIASIHYCAKNTSIYHILGSFYYFSLDQKHKKRFKTQFGTQVEILYKLQQYGIPTDLIPLTHSGAVKTNTHAQWIKSRKVIEDHRERSLLKKRRSHEQEVLCGNNVRSNHNAYEMQFIGVEEDPVVWVECPRSYDVIFRRGNTHAQQHLGNLAYKNLIEKTMDEHFAAETRQKKIDLTWKVVKEIECVWEGRFLNWDSSWKSFVQITDRREMRNKVARSMKKLARRMRKANVASRTIGARSSAGSTIVTPAKRQKMDDTTSTATNQEVSENRLPNCLNLCSSRTGGFGSASGLSLME